MRNVSEEIASALMQAIIEQAPDAVLFTDVHGTIRFVNAAFTSLTGYSAEEVLGKNPRILKSGSQDVSTYQELWGTLLGGKAWRGELINRRKDGTLYHEEMRVSPVFGEKAEILGFIAAKRDVSELKVRELVEASEEKFRQLAENIREVFWIMSPDGSEIGYISSAYEQVWGRPREELTQNPKAWMDAIIEEDREAALQIFRQQVQGLPIIAEFRITCPDGKEKWIRDQAFAIRNSREEIVRLVGIAEDCTERKVSETMLRKAADRLQLATRAAEVGIWDWDIRKDLLVWDDQMLHLYGLRPEQFKGAYEAWREGLHPDDRERGHQEILRALSGEKDFNTEFRVVWPDGSVHNIRALALVQRDESGKPLHIIGTNWDITAQKRADEALRESNRRLQDAIEKVQLHAQEAAKANAAKSEFLANMSHEIRTPLNGVLGMADLLLDTALNPVQRSYAEIIRSSGDALLSLINDILDFSKIEARKLELDIADFDLDAFLEEFATSSWLRARKKGLELFCWRDPSLPGTLRGDARRLRQILVNLTENAIKFSECGEVVVSVTGQMLDDASAGLRFSVRDSGIGIAADKIELLFRKFSQVDTSTTRKYGGSGLGLAISKQLVEMMGGQIGVKSSEGEGSEFWFTMHFPVQNNAAAPPEPSPLELHPACALILHDSQTSSSILQRQLSYWDVRCILTESVSEAMDTLQRDLAAEEPIRFLIVDLRSSGPLLKDLAKLLQSGALSRKLRVLVFVPFNEAAPECWRSSEAIEIGWPLRPRVLRRVLIDQDNVPQPALASSAGSSLPNYEGSQYRVLLVEDNVTNQKVVIGLLRKFGLQADVAENGKQALHALADGLYDLVLMDLQMPIMDGIEATHHIRDPRSPVLNHEVPIVALTAHALQATHEECLAAGMNSHLAKPISASALADALCRCLPQGVNPSAPIIETPGLFDYAGMLQRVMNDEALAHDVIMGFLQDMPAQILELERVWATQDAGDIARQAHQIRGAAANVSAESLRALATSIEESTRSGIQASLSSQINKISPLFARTREAMLAVMNAATP